MDRAAVALFRAPNPGPLTGPGTNTWIFGAGEVVVIDPGPLLEDHLLQVAATAKSMGRVAAIVCTHHHEDHSEGAERLRELTGAPLGLFHRKALGIGELPLHGGDHVIAGDSELVVVHTPGHASDHICLMAEKERILFTGDHVLSGTTSVIWPPDGDMADYLSSLELVRQLPVIRLLPGHGDPIEDPRRALTDLIQHRLSRERQIVEMLLQRPSRPEELVATIYASYPKEVWAAAAQTVLAHCLKLEHEGRLQRTETTDGPMFDVVASP